MICGVEERMPFYDRRVVEFALALPDDVLAAQPVGKQFLRTALTDRLPPEFLHPLPTTDCEYLFAEAMEQMGGVHLFDRPMLAEAGFVDLKTLRAAASAVRSNRGFQGRPASGWRWQLWSAAAAEVWLRAITGRQGRVTGH
jgi:hypothetical protein